MLDLKELFAQAIQQKQKIKPEHIFSHTSTNKLPKELIQWLQQKEKQSKTS